MITSTSNTKIKNIMNIKKSAKARREQHCYLVEGPRMAFEVPHSHIKELYVTEGFLEKHREKMEGYRYEVISDAVCRHLSDTKTPQGIIALVKQSDKSLEEILSIEENPIFMVLENLQDPGNLGTIIRTSEGAGVTAVIMNQQTVDPYNPKVIRSTMGAIFRVPILIVPDLKETVELLKERNISVYAAHLSGKQFYNYDYRNSCAFLIGNEGNGLTDELSSQATDLIKIPMKGKVESLNAAIASTVLMYEVQRQREWK